MTAFGSRPSQPERIVRIDTRHEGLAPVVVRDLIDESHPVADDTLGGVVEVLAYGLP